MADLAKGAADLYCIGLEQSSMHRKSWPVKANHLKH